MQTPITTILLAAGRGERMRSAAPKALHALCGRPMLDWVLRAAAEAGALDFEPPIAVVGEGREHIQAYYGGRLRYVVQAEPRGEGDALRLAAMTLSEKQAGRALVLAADLPLLTGETLKRLLHAQSPAAMLCARPYEEEHVDAEEDCLPACAFDIPVLLDILGGLKHAHAEVTLSGILRACADKGSILMRTAEPRFSGILRACADKGYAVERVSVPPQEAADVNDHAQLHACARELRQRINHMHMQNGVTLLDAEAAYIDATVTIGSDCILYPGVVLEGNTHIGAGTVLYPGCRIADSEIGNACTAQAVVAQDAVVGNNVKMGPFVHLRPGTRIADNCKIGNYIEVKNSNVGEGSKLPHLSYIGDGDVGKNVNLGCGTVFVNYDGFKKHRTIVGDNAFIGCNTSLVAPVSVGANAFTAAGSVITQDVPPETLAVARAKQTNKVGYMEKLRQKRGG